MKKGIVLILTLTLIFTFTACANNNQNQGTTPNTNTGQDGTDKGALKNGTYEGKGDKWEYGDESATVIVSEGKISQVTLRRLDTAGEEVNYDEWTGEKFEGQDRPNLKQFRQDLANAIIQKQSTAVDDITGATVSSKNWKIAVDRALEQAEVK